MKNKLIIIAIVIIAIISIIIITNNTSKEPEVNVIEDNIIYEESIKVSTNKVNLNVGDTYQVNAEVLPYNATYKNVNWNSINTNIATVNNGLITGINPGSTMIHVATEKKRLFQIISVTVNPIDITKILVYNPNIEIYTGETVKIDYTIQPSNATFKNLTFNSSNENIAIVKNNEITGLNEGSTTITISSENGIKENINVLVKKRIIDVTKIELNKSLITLDIGKNETILAKISPSDATNKNITWKSSNENIASIQNGTVTAKSAGVSIITATSNNGKVAYCTIIVKSPPTPTPQITIQYESPITESSAFSKYSNIVACNSDSFKYRIIDFNGNDWVLAWMKDPAKQLNNALAVSDGSSNAPAESILENEINQYGYQNKCMVAANASFFNMSNGSILANVIISKGRIVRNNGGSGIVLGINKNGILKEYGSNIEELKSDGVTNTFGHSNRLDPYNYQKVDKTNRTVICQINRNNFILISGSGVPEKMTYDVVKMTKSATCYNLDGGGSRKLYYKTQSSEMTKRFGGGRAIPDMIYFVEQ